MELVSRARNKAAKGAIEAGLKLLLEKADSQEANKGKYWDWAVTTT